ncbi:MAG: ABC transporter permease [Marinifilaceae bacterium]|jgi:ABC-2 type transport system permease protein|nr:ABC transporter permease [Marinifilaceae bacterium]
MRVIFRIVKTELIALFGQPISWLILAVFSMQASFSFIYIYEELMRYVALDMPLGNITQNIFSGNFFPSIQNTVYLYLPLLTMGLMGKEYTSGSIKLLFSSPIKSRSIILAKYLSLVIFSLIMISSIGVLLIFSIITIDNFDYGVLFIGLLGIFLLMCTYSAIGLLISTLIKYPIGAGLCTYALFTALNFIGDLGADIPIVRDITYWLSLSDKASDFILGIISSSDLIYFITISGLMLFLANLRLHVERGVYGRKKTIILSVLAFGFVFCIGYFVSQAYAKAYYDGTATKVNTLTKESQDILAKLDDDVKITTYVNILDQFSVRYAAPKEMLKDVERYEKYLRFKPDIKTEYVYYYGNTGSLQLNSTDLKLKARQVAKALDIDFDDLKSEEELGRSVDLSREGGVLTRLLETENGKSAFLHTYFDIQVLPSEREITSAFNVLTGDALKVYIMASKTRDIWGSSNRSISKLIANANNRSSLINNSCEIIEWKGEKNLNDADLLILADVSETISDKAYQAIKSYVERGRNLMLLSDERSFRNMNRIAALVEMNFKESDFTSNLSKDGTYVKALPTDICKQFVYYPQIDMNNSIVTISPASIIEFTGNHFFKNNLLSVNDNRIVATAVTRDRETNQQRVFVSSDADFLSFAELESKRNNVISINERISKVVLRWLLEDKIPLEIKRPKSKDRTIHFEYENLSLLTIIFIITLPILMLIIGLLIWLKRKKR